MDKTMNRTRNCRNSWRKPDLSQKTGRLLQKIGWRSVTWGQKCLNALGQAFVGMLPPSEVQQSSCWHVSGISCTLKDGCVASTDA